MKIKSVLAAIFAAAALSCTAVCAFADDADPAEGQVLSATATADGESETNSEAEGANSADDENIGSSIPENVSEAPDPMEGNPVSGVDGAAALAGIAMVAGAALVISHKHG